MNPKIFTFRSTLSVVLLLFVSCQDRFVQNSPSANSAASNVSVAIQSPEAGEVHRLLVRPGAVIENNAPLLEILIGQGGVAEPQVRPENRTPPANGSAGAGLRTAENEAEAARADAVRAESEVQRLTPLVAVGQASQGELDGARDRYERAQQRLQRAQQNAANDVVAARQSDAPKSAEGKSGRLIVVRAPRAGIVKDLSVRAGDRVTAGQTIGMISPSGQ